jgi:hypothetical protein
MGVGDEEEIRRAFLARHPGLRIPSPNGDHLVDLEGHVYRRSATGWYRTAENNWRAASQLRGAMAVYVAKSVAGQPLYEDPRLVPPITGIPPLPLTAPPTNRGGLGILGCLGVLGGLAIVGVVLAVLAVLATRHHSKTPEALIPQITHVSTYQEGVIVYARVQYNDPGHDAAGFGFVGANGAGWAEENHSFADPSYGIPGPGRVDYPFNIGCGTGSEDTSDVQFWINDTAGDRSEPVIIHLACKD